MTHRIDPTALVPKQLRTPKRAKPEVSLGADEIEFAEAVDLFKSVLRLLVNWLNVDSAVTIQLSSLGFETVWSVTRKDGTDGPEFFKPHLGYCTIMKEKPNRILVIGETRKNKHLAAHPELQALNVRAYIGVPLHRGSKLVGVLSIMNEKPMRFTRGQLVLVNIIGNLLSKAMEVEHLKRELYNTKEALDLSMALITDSAMESPDTGLPNRRFLFVWLRGVLFMARRRSEVMAVALWNLTLTPKIRKQLQLLADRSRGEDLLVDLGRGAFALLMPHTLPEGAEICLDRIREVLGPQPMGATLWHPKTPADADDFSIRGALRRATEALSRCQSRIHRDFKRAEWIIPKEVRDL